MVILLKVLLEKKHNGLRFLVPPPLFARLTLHVSPLYIRDKKQGWGREIHYSHNMCIRVAFLTQNLTNMAQTTYLHVLIDIFMSAELKKMQ